jgi:enterochelin esterase-like enzyme
MFRHGRRPLAVAVTAAALAVAATVASVDFLSGSGAAAAGISRAQSATGSVAVAGSAAAPAAATPATQAATPVPQVCTPVTAAHEPQAAALPGHVDSFTLGGHSVLVDVPGAVAALPGIRFPVVYFLHGTPGTAESWITGGNMPAVLDSLEASGQLPPIIAVFPDDQGVISDDSWWGNDAIGDSVATWFVDQLVPAIDSRYPTLGAAYRGIAGISAGGFGAVNISLQNPGVFSWVASYSGVFSAPSDIFGGETAANSPQLTAADLPAVERTPLFLGGGANDTEFLPDTQQFIATVTSLGWQPLRTEIVPGPHGWQAWSVEAKDSLVWLGQLWAPTC